MTNCLKLTTRPSAAQQPHLQTYFRAIRLGASNKFALFFFETSSAPRRARARSRILLHASDNISLSFDQPSYHHSTTSKSQHFRLLVHLVSSILLSVILCGLRSPQSLLARSSSTASLLDRDAHARAEINFFPPPNIPTMGTHQS
jgi:hypothetical protein